MFAGDERERISTRSRATTSWSGRQRLRNEGMFGFDWGIGKGNDGGDADMRIPIFTTVGRHPA